MTEIEILEDTKKIKNISSLIDSNNSLDVDLNEINNIFEKIVDLETKTIKIPEIQTRKTQPILAKNSLEKDVPTLSSIAIIFRELIKSYLRY